MRITRVRLISQIFFIGLALFFAFITQFSYLKGYPVSLFLEVDPLVAIASSITTHTLYRGLIWSLVILIPTLLLGRFFCNWICPYGTLHQFVGWLFNNRGVKERMESNRYRKWFALKYYILIGMLVAAAFGSCRSACSIRSVSFSDLSPSRSCRPRTWFPDGSTFSRLCTSLPG